MHEKIITAIQHILTPRKPLIAIKVWEEIPEGVPAYEDKAFPGTCAHIGEVIETGKTFYIRPKNVYCTGGVLATGILKPPSEEQSRKMIEMHLEMTKDCLDVDTAMRKQKEMLREIPYPKNKNKAAQIGLLRDMEEPDIVILFCTPKAADVISRAYAYRAGEPIKGFGATGGCTVAIQYPFVFKKPAFTYTDVAWRKFVRMSDDELTVSFPYESLVTTVGDLPMVAEHYEHYAEGMEL